MGLQALSLALSSGAVPRDPVLFRLPGLSPIQRELYAAAPFASVRDLDWARSEPGMDVPGAHGFDVLDLRDFAFDPAFRCVAMIDYFLGRLGAAAVPWALRRNAWLADHVAPDPPALPPGYVLVCPDASMTLRDMPDAAHEAILGRLSARTVATQRPPPQGSRAFAMPAARTLAELCGWVAHAGLVVSTDTAMVHLADAFSIPCLAIFTTHRPEWRARDYPFCRTIHRPAAGLPPALEFSRGPGDVAATQAAWFDPGGDLAWLVTALDDALGRLACST